MTNLPRTGVRIFGASLDVGNRGVRALGVSLAGLFATASPGVDVVYHYPGRVSGSRTVPTSDSDLEVGIRNYRMSPKSRAAENLLIILALAFLHRVGIRGPARGNPWLRSLLDADLVGEIRGGDSFSDIYGVRRFFFGCLPLVSVLLLRRRYVLLPQTYGPFRSRAARHLASTLLRRADSILTRDRNCEAIVRDLCGRSPLFCPDVAFTLASRRPDRVTGLPPELPRTPGEFVVGVNVSGLLYMGGYTGRNMFGLQSEYPALIDKLLEELLQRTNAKILLVPHVFGSEREEEACASIMRTLAPRYPGRVFAVTEALSASELKWVIGQTDFFVGSRMHACIAALSQCVPAIALAYSDKFRGVFDSVGVGQAVIDLRNTPLSEVVDQTLDAAADRARLRVQLQAHIPRIQHQVRQTFHSLVQPISSVNAWPA
jgi:colanic acid/amylovoran biosynthesis protein